jgi:hypothetical protein
VAVLKMKRDNMMKYSIVEIILIVALIATTSAETIQFGNYTATFNMSQPHIIDNSSIRTFYGSIFLHRISEGFVTDMYYIGDIKFSDRKYGKIYKLNTLQYVATIPTPDMSIISSMNLTSTIDFLKTLKIEKKAIPFS